MAMNNQKTMDKTKLTAEPILIKAGDQRVKLGFNNSPPKVDCRVLSEEKYQELLGSVNAYKEELRKEIENWKIECSEKFRCGPRNDPKTDSMRFREEQMFEKFLSLLDKLQDNG